MDIKTLRTLAGLKPDTGWPKKITVRIPMPAHTLAEVEWIQERMTSMGYTPTTTFSDNMGMTTTVFVRLKDGITTADELLRRCLTSFGQELQHSKPGSLLSETWELISDIREWLGEG